MKQAVALLLAVMLVLGLNTMAFAASAVDNIAIDDTIYTYEASSKKMVSASDDLVPGKTYYYWMKNDSTNAKDGRITSTDALKNYRISYTKDKNVDKVGFAIKDLAEAPDGGAKGKYAFVAIAVKDKLSSDSLDVDTTIKLAALSSSKFNGDASGDKLTGGVSNFEISFYESLSYGIMEVGTYTTMNEKAPIADFDQIDDTSPIELYFGDLQFDVNAKNQKELFLLYTDDVTDTKMDLTDKYPDASIEYHIFKGSNKTFTRSGTLKIPASMIDDEKAPYLYTIGTDGKLTAATGAKYNKTEQQFEVETKTLNNYVVSDKKLSAGSASTSDEESSSSKEDESSSTPKPPVTSTPSGGGGDNDNPATGTNDLVGLAVGLTAVSLVAIAAASIYKRK